MPGSGAEPLITARNAAESGTGDEQLIFHQREGWHGSRLYSEAHASKLSPGHSLPLPGTTEILSGPLGKEFATG